MFSIAFLDENFPFPKHQKAVDSHKRIQAHTVSLAEAFAQQGNRTVVFGNVQMSVRTCGVDYTPLSETHNASFDLAIANNNPVLFSKIKGKKLVLWLHAPTLQSCLSFRFFLNLVRYKPALVFSSALQQQRWGILLPFFQHHVIRHGVHQDFIDTDPIPNSPPQPRAIFIANNGHGLDEIVKLWCEHIFPKAPKARLDIIAEKPSSEQKNNDEIESALSLARSKTGEGINLCRPFPRQQHAKELRSYRVLLSFGRADDNNDTTAAEAQAIGLPVVATTIGPASEIIVNGLTGFIAPNPLDYADSVVQILKDDVLWQQCRAAALIKRTFNTWQFAATVWKKLF